MKLKLDQLEPNRWNPNEVTGEKYQLLVKDMSEAGQREPVTVSPRNVFYGGTAADHGYVFYVICDGEHRYKAAKELGWEELEATVEELTEDQAVTRFYRQQATRGGFDPLREARLFQHYLAKPPKGLDLTQEQVVEQLGLKNRAYLTDRIMLLDLSPLVQDLVANLKGMIAARIKERATNETEEELKTLTEDIVARATITLRHLRPISTLPENDQALLVSSLIGTFAEGGTVSVSQVESMARDVKARNEKLESNATDREISEALGQPPVPEERGGISEELFGDEQEDVESDEGVPEPDEEPLSLLMPLTADELHSRLVPWILGKVDELSDVKSIRIEGLRDREEILLEYAELDAKGRAKFSFRAQTTTPVNEHTSHIDSWSWTSFDTRQTPAGLEVTSGKLSSAEEKDLAEISRFIDETVYKDLDPWDDPDALAGPTGFTLTPVDSKGGEPTPPVPDHGRDYQEDPPDLDAGEEHHEHYDRDEDPPEELPTCPACGKQSPNAHYCTSCGALFDKEEPQEEPAHALTDLEQEWSATATGKLGGLVNRLGLDEALWLRGRETRRRAQKHLDRRIAEIRVAGAPTLKLEE